MHHKITIRTISPLSSPGCLWRESLTVKCFSNREPTAILDSEPDLLVQHNDSFAHSTVIPARVGHLQLPNVHLEGSVSSEGLQTVSPRLHDDGGGRRPGRLNEGVFCGADPFAEVQVEMLGAAFCGPVAGTLDGHIFPNMASHLQHRQNVHTHDCNQQKETTAEPRTGWKIQV